MVAALAKLKYRKRLSWLFAHVVASNPATQPALLLTVRFWVEKVDPTPAMPVIGSMMLASENSEFPYTTCAEACSTDTNKTASPKKAAADRTIQHFIHPSSVNASMA